MAKTKTPRARKAKKPRSTRTKPAYLPGMEPPRIKALDDAADIYYDAMQDRLSESKAEKEAKVNLIEKMKEHGLDVYETAHGLRVSVINKSEVKCKKKADVSDNGEASDGEE